MESDFAAAKVLLELAREELRGPDPTSEKMRQAIDLFIEAIITAQHKQLPGQVIPFPSSSQDSED